MLFQFTPLGMPAAYFSCDLPCDVSPHAIIINFSYRAHDFGLMEGSHRLPSLGTGQMVLVAERFRHRMLPAVYIDPPQWQRMSAGHRGLKPCKIPPAPADQILLLCMRLLNGFMCEHLSYHENPPIVALTTDCWLIQAETRPSASIKNSGLSLSTLSHFSAKAI